jgi:two-component system cell cycle sensor histidine kinase/response regulator CckA
MAPGILGWGIAATSRPDVLLDGLPAAWTWGMALAVLLLAVLLAMEVVRGRRQQAGRRNAEQAVAHFRGILQDLPDAVFVLDQGAISFVNQRALDLLGRKQAQDVIGRPFSAFFQLGSDAPPLAGEKGPGAAGKGNGLLDTRSESLVDSVWQRVDGQSLQVQFRIRTVEWEGRRAMVLVAKDVTRLRALQKDREQLQEQLNQSQKMQAVGHLAGGLAHEFNNLLTGIVGNAELILSEGREGPWAEQAQSVIEAAQRAVGLTSKLLAFARKGKFRVTCFDVHELIRELNSLVILTFPRNITVIQDLKAQPAVVRGDRNQIYQALMNLSLYARDAMPEGGRLSFTTAVQYLGEDAHRQQRVPKPGSYFCLTVADTGCGIDEGILPHIFEPFFTTKPQGQSAGLGLSMVYGTVQNHGGSITVETERGKGTSFRILLPLLPVSAEAAPSSETEAPSRTGTILVVDPEQLVILFLSKLFRSHGYTVFAFPSTSEALERMSREPKAVDLVVADLPLAEQSGRRDFESLRRQWPEVPVIHTSGYSSEGWDQELPLRAGVEFLPKPFQSKEILGVVRRLMSR